MSLAQYVRSVTRELRKQERQWHAIFLSPGLRARSLFNNLIYNASTEYSGFTPLSNLNPGLAYRWTTHNIRTAFRHHSAFIKQDFQLWLASMHSTANCLWISSDEELNTEALCWAGACNRNAVFTRCLDFLG